ncbi:MAG TPA: hypothetical protein VHX86_11825 [Tepidisphaeraceae bacterium]|jgi:hypothetical protein|nr:hypothetical protein [Tepidisphaeraceae bacterium]
MTKLDQYNYRLSQLRTEGQAREFLADVKVDVEKGSVPAAEFLLNEILGPVEDAPGEERATPVAEPQSDEDDPPFIGPEANRRRRRRRRMRASTRLVADYKFKADRFHQRREHHDETLAAEQAPPRPRAHFSAHFRTTMQSSIR